MIHPGLPPAPAAPAIAAGNPHPPSAFGPLSPEPYPLSPAFLSPAFLSPALGVTLVELIIVIAILGVLAAAAVPVTRFQVKRTRERELHRDLWEMRAAIDHYKDAADKGAFQVKADSFGYPPDLQTLVDGVDAGTKKVRFLRKIPIDPMTKQPDWATNAMQDDPDSTSSGSDNVFDIHSKSEATALDGTKYSTW